MLKAFFKPKWQHKDTQVRMQALQGLDMSRAENRAVLHQAASSDLDARVRRVAIKRMNDLDALWNLTQHDSDSETRGAARHRFAALLAGVESDAPPLDARLQRLAMMSDAKVIEDMVRRGAEAQLRRAALERIDREALLGDVALSDADAELRAAAVERITQKSTLERVAKQARMKDKRVSGMAREKLEKIAVDAERPARLRQRARHVCAELDALVRGKDLNDASARMHAAETEWTAVLGEWDAAKDGAIDPELTQRYAAARVAIEKIFSEHEQELAQQRANAACLEEQRARKRELCEQLEKIAADLSERAAPSADDERDAVNALRIVRDAWRKSGAMPNAEEQSLRARYDASVKRVEDRIGDIPRFIAAQTACAELLSRARSALDAEPYPQESTIKSLEKERKAIQWPRLYALEASAQNGIDEIFSQLRARRAQHAQQVKDDVEKLKQLVEDIEQAVADGQSKRAAELQRDAQQLLDALPPHEAATLRKQGVLRRWQAAGKNIRELWSWKKWAGAPIKERLVEEMEALARAMSAPSDVERDFHDIAQHIRAAREQWKSLGATDNAAAKELWERFNAACEAAHAPCAAYFAVEREQRAEHARRKESVCVGLEQFIAQMDWERADWKKVEGMLRGARDEWSRIGPVDRAHSKALSKRFRALMDDLAARIGAERKLNKSKKETLIKRMQQIADSVQDAAPDAPAVHDAIAQAKQLQAQWKEIGVSTESNALWNAFRAASDRVFARRQALHEAQDQERRANLERKRALCAQIAESAQLQGDALSLARGKVQQAKTDFERVGPVPKPNEREIQQLFRDACRAFEQQERARREQAREQTVLLLQRKAQLCAEVEADIDAMLTGELASDSAALRMRNAQESWQALASLDDGVEKRIAARFQNAIEILHGLQGATRDAFVARFAKQQQENLAAKEQVCLRAEIMAEIESPPEYRQQRMQYQVDQLARRMRTGEFDSGTGGRADLSTLLREWDFIGAIPAANADALRARLERARGAMQSRADATS